MLLMRHFGWFLLLPTQAPAETVLYQLLPSPGSRFELRVHKTGLMRGKTHVFALERYRGALFYDPQSPTGSRVELTVEASSVLCKDTWVSAKDLKDIQEHTFKKMLEPDRYPELNFSSTGIRAVAGDEYAIQGALTIRRLSRPVAVMVRTSTNPNEEGLLLTGSARLKMTDYGLKPPSAVLGAIGTKDEMEVSFSLRAFHR